MAIFCLGSLNIDYTYHVPHFCTGGETLHARDCKQSAGGKGLNQSIAAARSGAKVFHSGLLGPEGELLRTYLERDGVNTSLLGICEERQGHAMIQVDPTGQNSIVVYGGSNLAIGHDTVDKCLAAMTDGDLLMLQNEISQLPYILEQAAKRNIRVILNASPVDERLLSIDLSGLEWLIVNELECAALANAATPEQGYKDLQLQYPRMGILLTLGAEGSLCWKDGQTYRQSAFPADVKDTTGAGDTFAGYFVSCLNQGCLIEEALRTASAAASIAVSRPGAAPSIPTIHEVQKYLGKH